MDNISQAYEHLVQRIQVWAEGKDDIRLVFMLGSRARRDHPADEWADLDLAIAATDIRPYIDRAEWIEAISRPYLPFIERTGDGSSLERRVLFEGGLDVDFAFFELEAIRQMKQAGVPAEIADVFHRGVRVILDKDNWLPDPGLLASAWKPPTPPSESEFLQLTSDFWYHTVWTAKHLRRGEL